MAKYELRNDGTSTITIGTTDIISSEKYEFTLSDIADGYIVFTNFEQYATAAQAAIAQDLVLIINDIDQDPQPTSNFLGNHYTDYNNTVRLIRTFKDAQIVNTSNVDGYTTLDALNNLELINENAEEILNVLQNPTGFSPAGVNHPTTLSKNDSTRTFTISPTGSTFEVWVDGTKFTKTEQSIVWSDVEGSHVFYFDANGDLQETVDEAFIGQVIAGAGAIVAYVYWDATNDIGTLFEERHGLQMNGATHLYLHNTRGGQYVSGGALGNFTIGDGSLDTHVQFSFENTVIFDEDLVLDTSDASQILSFPAQIPCYYRSGANGDWRLKPEDTYPLIYSDGVTFTGANNRLPYNEWTGTTWQLSEVVNNDFVLVHYYATGGYDNRILCITGQNAYTTAGSARTGAESEISQLTGVIRLLAKEAVPIATVIFQTSSSYANTPKARIIQTDEGGNYVDWRTTTGLPNAGLVMDHGALSGLTGTDHHTQYALLAGRSGGQILIGGIDSGDDLTLQSTSNATRGTITIVDDVDMSSKNITNVNLVDGVDVSSHASRHISSGADEIDGDQLDIDWNPTNYIPTTSPTEVTSVDHLTAHLAGIDSYIGSSVPNTRTITAGAGLTGGGDLSTDRTINVVANADGSIVVNADDIQVGTISDSQHGSRSGGSLHSVATTSVAGFMSSTDKTKLDGIATGAQAGDVVGPASSTDNTIVRFNGTTGKLIQGSGVVVNDTNNISNGKSFSYDAQYDAGNSGTSKAIDFSNGQKQYLTLTGNVTSFTLSAPGVGHYTLLIIQDGTGGYSITWPSTVRAKDSKIQISSAASSLTIVTLYYNGSIWVASSIPGLTGTVTTELV